MNTTRAEKKSKQQLLSKTWRYLDDNFHKFSQNNKIKIALALCIRDLTTEKETVNPELLNEELEIIPTNGGMEVEVKNRLSTFISN